MSEEPTNSAPADESPAASAQTATAPAANEPPATPAAPPPTTPAPSAAPSPPRGRRYGFPCAYCSSRLEAVESMGGQGGTCPTCGNAIVIPILDSRGRLIDPASGKVIKQDPHPVHAYAAAGHKAPHIVTLNPSGETFIQCPRCDRRNPLSANNCLGCGLPFTMEGTVGDAIAGTNSWAVASFVLGIVGIPASCLILPPILALIFGFLAMRGRNSPDGKNPGQGLAIAGLILGTLGVICSGLLYSGFLGRRFF